MLSAVHGPRLHPLALDALIALLVLAVVMCAAVTVSPQVKGGPGFGERPLPAHTLVLSALAAAALVPRRAFPMPVLAFTCATTVLELLLGTGSHPPEDRHAATALTVVVALFTVAARTDRPTTWRVGLLTLATVTSAAMLWGAQPWYSSENLGLIAWISLAGVTGEALRSRRAVLAAVRERADRAERTREEEARRRVAEERMRIARELHDVVAHHIALVNVQAGVASHVMDSRPDQAREALAHVREASRRALSELQTTVGLLRHQDEPVAPTEPARGLAVLDELVEGFSRTGMKVSVSAGRDADAPGSGGPLPSAVDLAAYRVIQEALTNVHKHAGPGAAARVTLARSGGGAAAALDVTVVDDGPGTQSPPPAARPGGGHGLTGMRERAAALGGSCQAGPLEGGGFRVRVVLPLRPPAPPEASGEGQEPGGGLAAHLAREAGLCRLPRPARPERREGRA